MFRTTATNLVFVTALALGAAAQAATVTIELAQVARGVANKNGVMGTIDLTQGGKALDWMKTNTKAASPFYLVGAEKAGASLLDFTSPGISAYNAYGDDGYTLAWSGGDASKPGGAAGASYVGIRGSANLASNNVGFRTVFTAPSAGDYCVTLYSAATDPVPFDLTATGWAGGALNGAPLANQLIATRKNTSDVDELTWTVNIVGASAGESFALDLFHVNSTTSTILAFTGATVVAVPEPASIGILAVGLGAMVFARRPRHVR